MKKWLFLLGFFAIITFVFLRSESGPSSLVPEGAKVASSESVAKELPKPRSAELASPGIPAPVPKTSDLEYANLYLQMHKEEWQIKPYHDLRPVPYQGPTGTRVRYDVFQDGMPILGMAIVLQVAPDHSVTLVDNTYHPVARIETSPESVMSPQDVIDKLEGRYLAGQETISGVTNALFSVEQGSDPELVYLMSLGDKGRQLPPVQLVVRAVDGQILRKSVLRSGF